MAEEILLDWGAEAKVSTTRVVLGSTTFAVRNITSTRTVLEPRKTGWALAGVVCLLVMFGSLSSTFTTPPGQANEIGPAFFVGVIALFLSPCCFWWFTQSKKKYWICLTTSGAETRAMFLTDWPRAQELLSAINEAIAHQS